MTNTTPRLPFAVSLVLILILAVACLAGGVALTVATPAGLQFLTMLGTVLATAGVLGAFTVWIGRFTR